VVENAAVRAGQEAPVAMIFSPDPFEQRRTARDRV